MKRDKTKRMRKMKNSVLAILTAPAAIPPKPKTAAIIATTKNISAHDNITTSLSVS